MSALRKLLALAAAIIASFALTAHPVGAGPAGSSRATISKGFGCTLILRLQEGEFLAMTTDMTIEVDTVSGNTTLLCRFETADFLSALPTTPVRTAGFDCVTFAGASTKTMAVITTTGNAVLVCQITPNE